MSVSPRTTLCALLYGNYPALARRCLESTRPLWSRGAVKLRLGANSIGAETQAYIEEHVLTHCDHSVVLVENALKYPVSWRLFHEQPITTELIQWFDDDTFLKDPDPFAWLARVEARMGSADMLGQIWYMRLQGQQHRWIESREWYTGKPVDRNHQVRFATGGWWCIRAEHLQRYQWPDVEIIHRGGDVMLGELCRQQDLRLEKFSEGVAINADSAGRDCKAARRGYDEPPVGKNYHGDVEITREVRARRIV